MITLDIETYKDISDSNYISWKASNIKVPGNYTKQETIDKYIADKKNEMESEFALSPLTGKIILIGLLVSKVPPGYIESELTKYNVNQDVVYHIPLSDEDEAILLSKFWQIFSWFTLNDGVLITFNGKKFDLPFILHRSIIKKALIPRKIQMSDYLSKYKHYPHFDGYNWFDGGSLVEWSYRLGNSNSLQRDGYKIGQWYEAGEFDKIKDKNLIDLSQSLCIYQSVREWL